LQYQTATHILGVNCVIITRDRPRQPSYEIKPILSHISRALAHISCDGSYRSSRKGCQSYTGSNDDH